MGGYGSRVLAWLVLAVFSLLMGWVLAQGFALHQPRAEVLPWGPAAWIGLADDTEMLYLRRRVVLGSAPQNARLMVGATDHFEVYVNGESAGREDYLGERPSAVYDVSRLLRGGVNTIAIQVARSSKRHRSQAIVALDWTEGEGRRQLVSDAGWRASGRREVSPGGLIEWQAEAYPDSHWQAARVMHEDAVRDLPQPDSLSAALFDPPPRGGAWVWHHDPLSGVGSFVRDLRIDDAWLRDAWLGVAVDGLYSLAVNGHPIEATSGGVQRMDVHDLAPYLRRGDNRIELQVSGGAPPMRLGVLVRIDGADGVRDIQGDEAWRVSPGGAPVAVLAGFGANRPALAPAQSLPTQAWLRWQRLHWLACALAVFSALWIAGAAWALFAAPGCRPRRWLRYAQPWFAAALLLAGALLADLDARLTMAATYAFWLPAAALMLAAAVALMLWLGTALGRRAET